MIVAFPVLATIFVILRTYSRYLSRNFCWDDYLILLSTVLLFGQTLTIYKYVLVSGTGYHIYDLPKQTVAEKITALKWSFAVQMFYHPLMCSIRASIIVFLFRMKDYRRRIRYSLHIVFWLNVGYTIATSLGNTLQCNPVRYAWLKPEMDQYGPDGKVTIPGGKCFDSRTFVLSSCTLSIFMDLIIIPIPTIMVWDLQMSRKTKSLVVLVMSLGWISTGVSVGRFIVYYYRFAPTNLDRTWDIGVVISIAEPAIHIITACAPATKGLFRMLFPSFGSEYDERYPTYPQSDSKFGPRSPGSRPQPSGGFNFGLSTKGLEDDQDVVVTERERASPRGEDVYGMRPLGSVDSREGISHDHYEPSANEITASKPNTGYSKGDNDATEAEPKHILGYAR
ncbi:Structural maintenance of chromosomes protein 2 [Curvularia kusanoi]|uniref:Structural maintenance of chromosomes protein 2 n=1 Tax=Curvularia kusanoi TaxID=90978 RepID=A0A9P4WDZ4_CURKU|nr:Structural maintenance of chromosomes protein 2 [Curvularia kusanoi]